ncbi:superoxide dismutase [Candidatus Micrarchaeota archaeon]|nr:superoxide dismutase [Candidatus Micrarchaeota archaeon]MBU1930855.1 superoxide dismutase [Candidatus Micrarchaeota archaeon]
MEFELPKLPYEYKALEPFIDEKTMQIHHDKHHQAYVDRLNAAIAEKKEVKGKSIEELLAQLDQVPSEIRTAVRNNGGGHYNHSLYWEFMTPNSKDTPQGKLSEAITKNFGSFEAFQKRFSNAAATQFGSGWTWLVENAGKLEVVSTSNQDSPLSEGKTPILCIDVWEHSYYLKFQNRRPEYIENWWNVVNWKKVEEQYKKSL